jgi:hypothetical protein
MACDDEDLRFEERATRVTMADDRRRGKRREIASSPKNRARRR